MTNVSPMPVIAASTYAAPQTGTTIYVLLPVHNRRVLTARFARCLAGQTYRRFHLVLADDGSTDGTADAVRALVPDATVLRGRGDWWWAGGLQQGIDWLRRSKVKDDDLVLFINDDLTFAPDYLARAVDLMRDKQRTFVLSQFVSPRDGSAEETGTRADLVRLTFNTASAADEINCLSTQGLFAYWRDVRAVGNFHPRLLPHYLSDYEYTIRAHRLGFKCETSPELLIDLNRDSTGFHQIEERHFGRYLRKFFSMKSPANPIYFSTFVWLACPPRMVLPNLIRVWRYAMRTLARALIRSFGPTVSS